MNHYIPHRSRKFSIVRSGKPVAYEYGNSAFEAIGLLTIQETEGYAVKCQDKADNTSNELRKYEIYLNEHFITIEEGHSWVEAPSIWPSRTDSMSVIYQTSIRV